MPEPISAVVITFNEAAHIAACVASLRQVSNDIVVVDSFSTDATPAICQELGVRFIQHAWQGYAAQKNFANTQAQHDWVLSLDADEQLSPQLVQEINTIFAKKPDVDAFKLKFRSFFCGKPVRYGGWNPEWHVRLFRKSKISWNTEAVHEGLTIEPKHQLTKLNGLVYHYTVQHSEEFVAKTEHYSTLFAQKARLHYKKPSLLKLYLSPVVRFLKEYVLKLGFLDGWVGWFIAKENARYTYLKYKKSFRQ